MENTYNHYNDGIIDISFIYDFCLIVFVHNTGKSTTLSFDTWHFWTGEIAEEYINLCKMACEDEQEATEEIENHLDTLKQWLVENDDITLEDLDEYQV